MLCAHIKISLAILCQRNKDTKISFEGRDESNIFRLSRKQMHTYFNVGSKLGLGDRIQRNFVHCILLLSPI